MKFLYPAAKGALPPGAAGKFPVPMAPVLPRGKGFPGGWAAVPPVPGFYPVPMAAGKYPAPMAAVPPSAGKYPGTQAPYMGIPLPAPETWASAEPMSEELASALMPALTSVLPAIEGLLQMPALLMEYVESTNLLARWPELRAMLMPGGGMAAPETEEKPATEGERVVPRPETAPQAGGQDQDAGGPAPRHPR